MNIEQYVKRFFPYQDDKEMFYPGEHHFVALYLLPLLIKNKINPEDIFYVNPDGMKSKRMKTTIRPNDLSFFHNGKIRGIEVKYSKKSTIEFSPTQYVSLCSNQSKSSSDVIIALVRIKNSQDREYKLVKFEIGKLKAFAKKHARAKKHTDQQIMDDRVYLPVSLENDDLFTELTVDDAAIWKALIEN